MLNGTIKPEEAFGEASAFGAVGAAAAAISPGF